MDFSWVGYTKLQSLARHLTKKKSLHLILNRNIISVKHIFLNFLFSTLINFYYVSVYEELIIFLKKIVLVGTENGRTLLEFRTWDPVL